MFFLAYPKIIHFITIMYPKHAGWFVMNIIFGHVDRSIFYMDVSIYMCVSISKMQQKSAKIVHTIIIVLDNSNVAISLARIEHVTMHCHIWWNNKTQYLKLEKCQTYGFMYTDVYLYTFTFKILYTNWENRNIQ